VAEGTELTKPKNLEEAMRDKIRIAFAELIPDESLDDLIQKEWVRFAEGEKDRYGNKKEADLTKMIRDAVTEWAKKELAPRIDARISVFFQEHWQVEAGTKTWDEVTDEALKKLVKDSGKTLAEYIMANFTSQVMQGVQGAISQLMNRGF
jgi:hypothetical protein